MTARGIRLAALAAVAALPLAGWGQDPLPLDGAIKRADDLLTAGPYKAEWDSLHKHREPEWFRDAKLGIYTHWGPVTVGCEHSPGDAEWYGRQMYLPDHPAFKFHQERFGDQKTVGYKEIIPKFTAEKFDPDAWADLFARAGAKFAGPVAVHHDNFANWDSKVTRWNSVAMGPHRDITGELEKAIRKRGMRFITTFHHGFAWKYFEPAFKFDAADGKNADLYGTPHAGGPPDKRFQDQWLGMVNEAVEKYQPDMIWFDFELGTVITPEYQRRMFATVYNWGEKNHREITVAHKHREIQKHTGLLDFERGREDRLTDYPWLTDTSTGTWYYVDKSPTKPLNDLVDVFVDIVSKNGCMLLNVGPRSDGTIPEESRDRLLGMGKWLEVNGEAIYGTRPWLTFGEGPTRGGGGAFSEERGAGGGFTASDIRFTTRGKTLYAIALDWPANGKLLVRSLASDAGKVASVTLLGRPGALAWTQTEAGLSVTLPAEKPCEHAFALKIDGEGLKPSAQGSAAPTVRPGTDGSVRLLPGDAEIHGPQARVEKQHGHEYIGAWDNPETFLNWKVELPAGMWRVEVVCTAGHAATEFVVELAGGKAAARADKTNGWFEYQTVGIGRLKVDKAGACVLTVRPKDATKWKAMNIREIKLTRVP